MPLGIDISQCTTRERSPVPHLDLLQRYSNPDRRQIGAISRLWASAKLKASAENTILRTKTKPTERRSDEQIRELVAAYQQVQWRRGRRFPALG